MKSAARCAFSVEQTTEAFWERTFVSAAHIHMPNFALLARIMMSLQSTSVENERTFSLMNLLKSALRNRMEQELLQNLCRIQRSHYTPQTFPYDKMHKAWMSTERYMYDV